MLAPGRGYKNVDREGQGQGRKQVCSQRWARLEKFPFPDFLSP